MQLTDKCMYLFYLEILKKKITRTSNANIMSIHSLHTSGCAKQFVLKVWQSGRAGGPAVARTAARVTITSSWARRAI